MKGTVGFLKKSTKDMFYLGNAFFKPSSSNYFGEMSVKGFESKSSKSKWSTYDLSIGGDGDSDVADLLKAGFSIGLVYDEDNYYEYDWAMNTDIEDQIKFDFEGFKKNCPDLKATADTLDMFLDEPPYTDIPIGVYLLGPSVDVSLLTETAEFPAEIHKGIIDGVNDEIGRLIKMARSTLNKGATGGKAETLVRQIKALQKQLNEYQ